MDALLKLLTALLIIFGLTACNKSASLTAESGESSGFKGEFSFSQNESKSATNGAKTVNKVQLLTSLVASAEKTLKGADPYFKDLSKDEVEKYKKGLAFNFDYNTQRLLWREGCGLDVRCEKAPQMDLSKLNAVDDEVIKQYAATLQLPKEVEDWFIPFDALIEKAAKGDKKAAIDYLVHMRAINDFVEGVTPSNGWYNYGKLSFEDSKPVIINVHTRWVRFANLFATEVVRQMPKNFKNPADIRHDFIVALLKIPSETIIQIYNQAGQEAFDGFAANKTMIDSVSGRGTSWTTGANSYAGMNDGWTIKTGGQTVFGQGYINGQLIEVEVSSSLEVAKKVEKGNRLTGTTGTDESAKGSVVAK
jgi:hypothetical protein